MFDEKCNGTETNDEKTEKRMFMLLEVAKNEGKNIVVTEDSDEESEGRETNESMAREEHEYSKLE